MTTYFTPKAIFENVEHLEQVSMVATVPQGFHSDYQKAKQFLLSYQHNPQTFKSFRRDIERFMQWSWFVKQQSCTTMRRIDIEAYLSFLSESATLLD